jgi:hypothetical protein
LSFWENKLMAKRKLPLGRRYNPDYAHAYRTGDLVYRCGSGKLYRVDWSLDCPCESFEVKVVCLETGVTFGIHISEIRKTNALEYLADQAE